MKRAFHPAVSLRLKLTFSILLAVLISMVILSLLLLTLIREELFGHSLDQAVQMSRFVERAVDLGREGRRGMPGPQSLSDILFLFAEQENLLGLALYDRGGGEIARQGEAFRLPQGGWRREAGGAAHQITGPANSRLLILTDLRGSDPPLRLGMLFSLEKINRVITFSQLRVILQVSLSALLLFVFLVFVLTVMVIKPLKTLSEGMKKISAGDFNHRIDLPSKDETGFLAESLNAMVASLNESRRTIENQVRALTAAHQATLEAQAKLIAAEKMASLGTLAAGVAHEVGNPLGAVIGYINLLLKGNLSREEFKECLTRASVELNRIHQIMLELINYARPAAEPSTPLDLNEILRELAENLGREELLEHLEVVLDLDPDLPQPVGHPHKMEQVFTNLIRNAVWATRPRGRLVISSAAATAADGGQPQAVLSFTDDGCGVEEGDRERIFDPFFTTRLGQGGTGLGLAISRRIVEEMGGSISVESAGDEKTSFVIKLPLC